MVASRKIILEANYVQLIWGAYPSLEISSSVSHEVSFGWDMNLLASS